MNIELMALPSSLRGPAEWGGRVPTRMLMMHPRAARSLMNIERETAGLVYSSIYRTAEAQLEARRTKRGTQPVGWSAHGYGFAFDLDLKATLLRQRKRYVELVEMLEQHYGFFCHVRSLDGARSEAWHFNYLGKTSPGEYLKLADPHDPKTWELPIEKRIQEFYGSQFLMSPVRVQQELFQLGLYHGEADGIHGPLTVEAIKAFQRTWMLVEDGRAGPITQRTLAFVRANRQIESLIT